MREIFTHTAPGLNDALAIVVVDEPGQGGACHEYQIREQFGEVLGNVSFQNGPIKEFGVNGISNEALLAIVKDRLMSFQAGPFSCRENGVALRNVTMALQTLIGRTIERQNRGVEGTNQV